MRCERSRVKKNIFLKPRNLLPVAAVRLEASRAAAGLKEQAAGEEAKEQQEGDGGASGGDAMDVEAEGDM